MDRQIKNLKKIILLYMKAKTTKTKLPFFAFILSFFPKGKHISKTKKVLTEEKQPDIYSLYWKLLLDSSTSIRSRAKSLNISRYLSQKITNELKNVQRNKRVKK